MTAENTLDYEGLWRKAQEQAHQESIGMYSADDEVCRNEWERRRTHTLYYQMVKPPSKAHIKDIPEETKSVLTAEGIKRLRDVLMDGACTPAPHILPLFPFPFGANQTINQEAEAAKNKLLMAMVNRIEMATSPAELSKGQDKRGMI